MERSARNKEKRRGWERAASSSLRSDTRSSGRSRSSTVTSDLRTSVRLSWAWPPTSTSPPRPCQSGEVLTYHWFMEAFKKIKWLGLVMRSRLELQTIHRKQSVFTITEKAPSNRGLHRDCENRWIFCSTTINARLLSVCLVNGYWLCPRIRSIFFA